MKALRNPRNFIEHLGRRAYPETPAGRRAADMITLVLIGAAVLALVYTFR
jgi:hypothetical protein